MSTAAGKFRTVTCQLNACGPSHDAARRSSGCTWLDGLMLRGHVQMREHGWPARSGRQLSCRPESGAQCQRHKTWLMPWSYKSCRAVICTLVIINPPDRCRFSAAASTCGCMYASLQELYHSVQHNLPYVTCAQLQICTAGFGGPDAPRGSSTTSVRCAATESRTFCCCFCQDSRFS